MKKLEIYEDEEGVTEDKRIIRAYKHGLWFGYQKGYRAGKKWPRDGKDYSLKGKE